MMVTMETIVVREIAHAAAQWTSSEVVDVAIATIEKMTVTAKIEVDVTATEEVVTEIGMVVKTVSVVVIEIDEIGEIETTTDVETVALDVAETADATDVAAAEVVVENVVLADAHVLDLDLVQETESHDQDHQETAAIADEAVVAEMMIGKIVMVVVNVIVIVATTIRAVDLDAEEETAETDVEEEMAVRKRIRRKTTKMTLTILNLTVTTVTSNRMSSVMVVVMTTAHLKTEAWSDKTTLLRKVNASKAVLSLQRITLNLEK